MASTGATIPIKQADEARRLQAASAVCAGPGPNLPRLGARVLRGALELY